MSCQTILIVTGGDIEDTFVCGLIAEKGYDFVIACDRGMEFFHRGGLYPHLIVGDFDSADEACVRYFQENTQVRIEQFPAEKDWTDTELAVRRALAMKPDHIDLVGAVGSRLDHVLGNLQLLDMGLEHGIEIFLLDAHNRVRLIDHSLTIGREEQYGAFISLIPYNSTVNVSLYGMKYPLDHMDLAPGVTLGISNEIVEEQAQICFTDGRMFVIESKD